MQSTYWETAAPRKKKSRSCIFIVLALTLIMLAGFFFLGGKTRIISPIPDDPKNPILGMFAARRDPDELKQRIRAAIGNSWKNYSVYVVDFESDFIAGINESEIFSAASVNKIPILAVLYDQAKSGRVNFDQTITVQEEDVQDYGTGSIRYDPPGSTYSVKTLARLMMQKSDNTAAFLLGTYVLGFPTVDSVISGWGLTQTDMVNNKTSNRDMAILMRRIYDHMVTSPALTAEMLGFMKDSDFEDRIPGVLPKDVAVYHKIGTGEGAVHDAGIVTRDNTAYYIGIFTADVTDIEAAVKLEAKISKIVFDYMN